MPPLAGERWYAVPKGGTTSDSQTGEDIEFIAFFLWKEVSPQVTEDSGFSAKIRGPQGPDMTQKQIAAK